jgi:hypothetical protein
MFDIILNMLKLSTRWKPDWLYEAMPYVYLLAGLATILYFDSPTGYGSGALLLVAVLMIGITRTRHRTFKNIPGGDPAPK